MRQGRSPGECGRGRLQSRQRRQAGQCLYSIPASDDAWFYPDNGTNGKVRLDQLEDWTCRPEEGVRHYSGIATYRTSFDFQPANNTQKTFLVTNVSTYDTMTGNTWGCKKCEERKKSGKPAELLSSGLLGPVRLMAGK